MFTEQEIAYLREQPLARLATINEDGQPDVVPLAFEYDGTHFWVGGVGAQVLHTRKFRNITAGRRQVSLVADDLVSLNPFIARAVRVYGIADDPICSSSNGSSTSRRCASSRRSCPIFEADAATPASVAPSAASTLRGDVCPETP